MDARNRPPAIASIQFLTGPLAGSSFQINKPSLTLGREPTNDIRVADPSVSRQHARIAWNGEAWSIVMLAQQNILTVNGSEVRQAILNDHDTIGLGTSSTFLFLSFAEAQAPSPAMVESQSLATKQRVATPQQENQTVRSYTPAFPPRRRPLPTQVAAEIGVPSFEISNNIDQEKQIYSLTQTVTSIGRDASNDIVINEPIVSGVHMQIVREGNELVLVHPHPTRTGTLNGLLYQGRKVRGDEPFRKPLARGDIFRIGDENGTLVTLTYNDGSGAEQEVVPEIHPIPLDAPVITIGRYPENIVVLNHPQVSGYHARLVQEEGGYRIIDQDSTNHVYVNAQRVTSHHLKSPDEIRIGPFRLTYTGTQLTQYDESNSIRIDALNLKRFGNKNLVLINDISLAIPPRKFVALVGGSGAGKSTLMDALNGLRPAQQGAVYYNGQDYYQQLAAFSTQLGYVPQDDIVHRDLTVERALYYAAKMRLPDDFTEAQVKQRIAEVLEDVEMTHRSNLLVSKLSGGQRKRVSIALELLANPSIFFLDEPTSGLDPGLDRKMMYLLRKLADKGHTIVLVTHATNNINACDYVCFLAQGGRLAYFGPPDEAKAYFDKSDFAEIYATLEPTNEKPGIPEEAETRFKTSPDYQKYVAEPLHNGPTGHLRAGQQKVEVKPPKRGKPWKQFSLLSRRYVELLKNDVGNLLILLLQAPIIALILVFIARVQIGAGVFDAANVLQCPTTAHILTTTGFVDTPNPSNPIVSKDCNRVDRFLKNDPRGKAYAARRGGEEHALQDFIVQGSGGKAQEILFIMAFAALMFGAINAAREIVKEAPIYRRERTVNLGIVPYMFSKIVVLGTLCLLQSAVLVIIVSIAEPFQQGIFLPPLLEVYITLALASLAGLMVGLTVSVIAPNTDRAMSFIPLVLIPQVIFSGTVFPIQDWFTQVIGALFAVRWAMVALGSSIGLHSDQLGGDKLFGKQDTYQGTLFSVFSQGDAMRHLLLAWGAMLVMIVLLGCVIAYFLKRKDVRA